MYGARLLDASALIGREVTNQNGAPLARIEDFVVDLEQGLVIYAVLTNGDGPIVDATLVAVPWGALHFGSSGEPILHISVERMVKAPHFDREHWPDMNDPD